MHSEAGWKAVQSTVSPTRLKTRLGNLGNSQKLPESHTFVWRRALPSAGKKRYVKSRPEVTFAAPALGSLQGAQTLQLKIDRASEPLEEARTFQQCEGLGQNI